MCVCVCVRKRAIVSKTACRHFEKTVMAVGVSESL